MPTYQVGDWYWLSESGRLYSSAKAKEISVKDPDYVAWAEAGGIATAWPRDETGAESDTELSAVLALAGLSVAGLLPAKLSSLEFMDLFTDSEQLGIVQATMSDPATKLWYDRVLGAQYIDFADERLAAGLQKMVDAKLLTSARRNRVLKGQMPA